MTDAVTVTTVTMIGFGELGQSFCRDFAARGGLTLKTYDIVFGDDKAGPQRMAVAEGLGVQPCRTAAEACAGADVVFSAVTADKAEAVAGEIARVLVAGQVYMDVNSASPGTKQRAAKVVEARGAHYVEGAVMGAVKGPGIKVEILAGGPAAVRTATALNALGMKVEAVATEHGKASAIKLCRSIMIKGMEALMVDCARATKHWGVEEPVYASLDRTFPGSDWGADRREHERARGNAWRAPGR